MGLPAERLAILADLRARIAAPRVLPGRVATGLPGIDAWIGGWPRPGVAEIVGVPGSGRLGLVIPAVAALTRRGRPVVVIDAMEQVFPPGWAHAMVGEGAVGEGVELSALWLVRPGLDRAAWAAEQVARSGAVEVVVLVACLLVLDMLLLHKDIRLQLEQVARVRLLI